MMARTFRPAVTVLLLGILLVGLFILFTRLVENLVLEDFTYTFYRSAQYAFRGENVYVNDYGRPLTATQYAPYNPIWILYALVPLSDLRLDIAAAVRCHGPNRLAAIRVFSAELSDGRWKVTGIRTI
jgi:hypothetical protein